MRPPREFAAALAIVPLAAVHGPWSRAIGYRHLQGPPPGLSGPPQPLWGGAARMVGARFTPPGSFDSLYLADNPVTAFLEVSALIQLPGGPVPVLAAPWVVVSVEGELNHVLDLTQPAILAALGITPAEVTAPWVTAANPPMQVLGRLTHRSRRVVGIRYASAKHPGGTNLVVFPERLDIASGNYLEVYDPHRQLSQRLGSRSGS